MRTKTYVELVSLGALLIAVWLWRTMPADASANISTLGTLATLALTAELMAFLLPGGVVGSIAFIPYVTTVLLSPNALGLAAIVGSGAIAKLSRQRNVQKFVFNCAQQTLAYGCAIVVYEYFGGHSLFALRNLSVSEVTIAIGMPMTIAYLAVFVLNGLLVCQVVA